MGSLYTNPQAFRGRIHRGSSGRPALAGTRDVFGGLDCQQIGLNHAAIAIPRLT
jgi:hypothetical protein